MSKIEQLEQALNAGEIGAARKILFELSEEERELLRAEIGDRAYQRCYRTARRLRRGPRKGRVILLHGIMGGDLAVVRKGDQDKVWTNYFRLFNGRISDLELTLDGDPEQPGVDVVVTGQNKKYYLPMLLELNQHWHAKAFAYDWRRDIAHSADHLAALVKTFGRGEPVHLVAHSMGGLVSRCFIKLYEELWSAMDDPGEHARGGRLVMLGTPNHGSYSIPLALSGEEKKVKQLAMLDRINDLESILSILNSFQGSYQMLPSQRIDNGDDHSELYRAASWGKFPVHEKLLERAAAFHESLAGVIDRERFVYVAGYDRETPFRIKIHQPGRFSYKYTRDGDGRVPHELGLLDGVHTLYVDETHGSLPISDAVLDGVHELLESGTTRQLADQAPRRRSAERPEWTRAVAKEVVPAEFRDLVHRETAKRGAKKPKLDPKDQLRIESLLLDDEVDPVDFVEFDEPRGGEQQDEADLPEIEIEVVWGDVTRVKGDAYAVGHYLGVLPQNAEAALDLALSRGTAPPSTVVPPERQILRQHTIRGNLRGELGEVDFFPWNSAAGKRTVAVAGMGRPGAFGTDALRLLIRKLVWSVANLPDVETICTVLIGSGEGNLSLSEAVHGLLDGICEALARGDVRTEVKRIKVVEIRHDRAVEIYEVLEAARHRKRIREALIVKPVNRTGSTASGYIHKSEAMDHLLGALCEASTAPKRSKARGCYETLVEMAGDQPKRKGLRRPFEEALAWELEKLAKKKKEEEEKKKGKKAREKDRRKRAEERDEPPRIPVRLSFAKKPAGITVAAISNRATVSERVLQFDPRLIEDVVEEINQTEEQDAARFSQFITRLVLPRKFREWLRTDGPFVFEVDRYMAQLHWEMLVHDLDVTDSNEPLGVRCEIARQLRTPYSPPPVRPRPNPRRLRALVVGDPGDPSRGHNLPGARDEALEVTRLLQEADIEVEPLIGSSELDRTGPLRGIEPATRVAVLDRLLRGGYDILHYSGHGDFDRDHPDTAGWVFGGGKLVTSRELEGVEVAPSLIVANACLSGRTADEPEQKHPGSLLLPSLADEFFYRGARNYVGTAWTVSDMGAVLFARELYQILLGLKEEDGPLGTLGKAVLGARKVLYEKRGLYGDLWAAYQHYGDPGSKVRSS